MRQIPSRWRPPRLIGDKAYDSDKLDRDLLERHGVEVTAPNRRNWNAMTQDRRALRRYKRRWKVERFFAWLNNFRRLVVRWKRRAANYLGFLVRVTSKDEITNDVKSAGGL